MVYQPGPSLLGMRSTRMITVGLAAGLLAVLGWLATTVALSFAAQTHVTEDLSAVWTPKSRTPLGRSVAVEMPADQTLVALLVGSQLQGIAGTTTGTCTASASGQPLPLAWPVHLDWRVEGRLEVQQQAVAVAGWTNPGASAVTAIVACDTPDSTVAYFVAVPSESAVIAQDPWFQPWAWVALGIFGLSLLVVGIWQGRQRQSGVRH